jgi:hypothetical protein
VAATACAAAFAPSDHLHANLLQRKLIVDRVEQIERTASRHLRATQLDLRILPGQLWMRFGHFAIEQK